MLFSGTLIKRFGKERLLALCLLSIAVRNLCYIAVPGITGAVAGQLLHSLSFGLFHPLSVLLCASHSNGKTATAMTFYTAVNGIAYVIGSMAGGYIIDYVGYPALFISFGLFPVAGIVTAVIGLLVALPTLKMSGIYLSIVTLGFSEIARLIALNWTALTGGALGIKGIPIPQFFGIAIRNPRRYYYVFLGFAILFLFVSHRVINSRIGRAWMSIRENELAAKSLGVDSSRYKISNFMYGAFWIGVAGAIYAPYVRFIDSTYFTLDEGWNLHRA